MRAAGMRGSRPALDTMPLADFRILPPKDNCATEPRDIYQMYGVERITCRPRIARRRPRLRAAWQRGRRRSHTCSSEQSSPPFISLAVFLCKILTLPDDSPRSSASPCTGCEFCSSASPREVGGENACVCGQSTSGAPEEKMRSSWALRPTRCHGVPGIFLTAAPSSAARALHHDQGAPRLDS
jgi:hypothetical protein